jgi:glycosyltransferase involved in cell wall biosynthesis
MIHVHGSERFYGMVKVTGLADVRMLVSIQGLLGSFSQARHFFGALSPVEIIRSLRVLELPVRLGLLWQHYYAKKGARREARILAAADGYLGRTSWDRAHVSRYNRKAAYYHVGEILRPVFYECRWSLKEANRHTLIYTNAGHPNRGTENLLGAMSLLQEEFPDIRLRLAGTVSTRGGYGRFIRRRINQLGLGERVEFLGYLDAGAMACALLRSHVFVITSYIENSPNSLAEAMLVGMPCVASCVGGIPDMVQQGTTGLLYPVDDVPMLADRIRKVFADDKMAVSLGGNARAAALERHDPDRVIKQLVLAYEQTMNSGNQDRVAGVGIPPGER